VSKPHFSLQALFAEGASKQESLQSLLRLNLDMVNRSLALNRNLTPAQITKLLSSKSITTAVITASRYDLDDSHAALILKDERPFLRHAFLTRPHSRKIWDKACSISEENLTYALAQSWCTPDYAYAASLTFAKTLTPTQRAKLEEFYGLNKVRALHGPTARPSLPRTPSFKNANPKVLSILANADFESYLNLTGRGTIAPERLDDLLDKDCFNLLASINRYSEPHRTFVQAVESLIGEAAGEFYEIFFQTLPTWHGSLRELISTANSLTSQTVS